MASRSAVTSFRWLSIALTVLAIGLAALAVVVHHHPMAWSPAIRSVVGGASMIVVLLALGGPLRIGLSGRMLPREIKSTMVIVGTCAAIGAGGLAGAAAHGGGPALVAAIGVCAASVVVAAWAGFIRLSTRLPASFMTDELLGIAKSAIFPGKDEQSPADVEFRRWSTGRSGLAVGAAAPDGEVVTLDGHATRLAEYFVHEGRPATLVLNFGSYSCPHHRRRIDELHALIDQWQPRGARFLTVYITEAHPEDGWRLAGQYTNDPEHQGDDQEFCFLHARTLDDRLHMAKWLADNKALRMPVVADTLTNELMFAYNAWPIRLYVIHEGRVAFTGDQGPFGYAPAAVDEALRALIG